MFSPQSLMAISALGSLGSMMDKKPKQPPPAPPPAAQPRPPAQSPGSGFTPTAGQTGQRLQALLQSLKGGPIPGISPQSQ
jgi:hypothetical protein